MIKTSHDVGLETAIKWQKRNSLCVDCQCVSKIQISSSQAENSQFIQINS
jgi:hypothetical protein